MRAIFLVLAKNIACNRRQRLQARRCGGAAVRRDVKERVPAKRSSHHAAARGHIHASALRTPTVTHTPLTALSLTFWFFLYVAGGFWRQHSPTFGSRSTKTRSRLISVSSRKSMMCELWCHPANVVCEPSDHIHRVRLRPVAPLGISSRPPRTPLAPRPTSRSAHAWLGADQLPNRARGATRATTANERLRGTHREYSSSAFIFSRTSSFGRSVCKMRL